jgi:hypothetical protein
MVWWGRCLAFDEIIVALIQNPDNDPSVRARRDIDRCGVLTVPDAYEPLSQLNSNPLWIVFEFDTVLRLIDSDEMTQLPNRIKAPLGEFGAELAIVWHERPSIGPTLDPRIGNDSAGCPSGDQSSCFSTEKPSFHASNCFPWVRVVKWLSELPP